MWPHALKPYREIAYRDFPVLETFASGFSDIPMPDIRCAFRFNTSWSIQVHVTFVHMTTVIRFCRVLGVQSFTTHGLLVPAILDLSNPDF